MIVKFYRYEQATGICTPVATVDDASFIRFQRTYLGIGTWELKLPMTSRYLSRIRSANMIRLGPQRAGLILDRLFEDNEDFYGITVSGAELKGLAAKRIVLPPSGSAYQSYSNAAPEYVMDQLLTAQLLAPANLNRRIIGDVKAYTPGSEQINYDGRFGKLAEDITGIAEASQVGWYADIEQRGIKWGLYRGVDRRVSAHATLQTVLLSASRDNLGQRSLELLYDVPNTAIVGGQGEGVDRIVRTVNDSNAGLLRNETFVDARDISDAAELLQRGEEKLAEESDPEVYSFAMDTTATDAYFTGYFGPGDLCTVRDPEFLPGGDLEGRLAVAEEIYEDDIRRVEATIGYDKQKLAAVIAKIRKSTMPLLTT